MDIIPPLDSKCDFDMGYIRTPIPHPLAISRTISFALFVLDNPPVSKGPIFPFPCVKSGGFLLNMESRQLIGVMGIYQINYGARG